MAVKDVRKYLTVMSTQALAMKKSLEDAEGAVKAGYITEDRLEGIRTLADQLEINYQRLLYIMYLIELPNDKKTSARVRNGKNNKNIERVFHNLSADQSSVEAENKSYLDGIRKQLKDLKKQQKVDENGELDLSDIDIFKK
jgi:hypothetical protein